MAARRSGAEHGALTDAAAAARRDEQQQHRGAMTSAEERGAEELSLEEILRLYNQPINEEQAWAVCYQCCRSMGRGAGDRGSAAAAASAGATSAAAPRRIAGPGDVRIQKDGSVRLDHQGGEGKSFHEQM